LRLHAKDLLLAAKPLFAAVFAGCRKIALLFSENGYRVLLSAGLLATLERQLRR
jgi:hypothetical protein